MFVIATVVVFFVRIPRPSRGRLTMAARSALSSVIRLMVLFMDEIEESIMWLMGDVPPSKLREGRGREMQGPSRLYLVVGDVAGRIVAGGSNSRRGPSSCQDRAQAPAESRCCI